MKRVFVIAMFAAVAFSFAFGQTYSSKASQNAKAEQEIRRLEREWFDSYIRGDRAAFDRIVANDAVITYGNGKVGNKSEAMAEIKAPADSSYSLTSDDVQVRVYEDTVIVTGRVTEKGTFNGRNVNSQSRYTDVWVRRNGRWQIAAAQNTRLPQERAVAATPPSINPNVYNAYVGQYELAADLVITITKEGNNLMSEVRGRKSELTPISETQFTITGAAIRVTFVKGTDGHVTHLTLNDNGKEGRARKIR